MLQSSVMMSEIIPGPAYRIHTPRLILRCWNPGDAQHLKHTIDENLEHLRPWMPFAHAEPQELQAKIERLRTFRGNFDLGQDFVYGVFNQDETRVLGGFGLHPRIGLQALEMGYWIHKDFTQQGLATEACAALIRVAFEIEKVKRIEIHCNPNNQASAAIPRKLGFTHEATLHNRQEFLEDEHRDLMIWSLFLKDYPNSPASQIQIKAFDVIGRAIIA
jgi:RimJ/RimL family protein N-acetyltransferase